MNNERLLLVLAMGALSLGASPQTQAMITIDHFDFTDANNDADTINTNGTTHHYESGPYPLNAVVGGYREITHQVFLGADPILDIRSRVVVNAPLSELSYSNDDGVNSRLTLTYDGLGMGGAAAGLGGINALADGNDRILLHFLNSDLGNTSTMRLTDLDGRVFINTLALSITGAHTDVFKFADFTYLNGPAGLLNFNQINRIEFEINAANAADYLIDNISIDNGHSVPEPMTLGLSAWALAALSVFATKRGRGATPTGLQK